MTGLRVGIPELDTKLILFRCHWFFHLKIREKMPGGKISLNHS